MKVNLYSVKDAKSGFNGLILEQNDAIALRNFEHAFYDKGSVYYSHAADFSLFRVGSFDSSTGQVSALGVSEFVLIADGSVVKERVHD